MKMDELNRLTDELNRLTGEFKEEVHDRAKEIDPSNEQDWFSLTVGWAIGKGICPLKANILACHIRYNTELG